MKKRFQPLVLACMGLIALGLIEGPTGVRADDVTGVVVSVEVAGKKIVVMDQSTSQPRDIAFIEQADIRTTTGKPLQIQNLKRGDRVGILYNGRLATKVVVNQVPLIGVVSTIDLQAQKLIVAEAVTNRDIEVVLNPATRVESTKHDTFAVKDIKTGDGITVVYSGAAPVEVMINSKLPELKGHIKSIAADMRSIILTELGNNADLTVAITPETTIISSTGKTLGMNDLRKGDGGGMAHRSSVASLIVVSPGSAP